MLLTVTHQTRYTYEKQVTRSTQYIRLTPRDSHRQRVLNWSVKLPIDGACEVSENDEGEPAGPVNPMVFLRATPLTIADAAIKEFVSPFRSMMKSRPLIGTTELMGAVLDKMPYTSGSTNVESSAAQSFAMGKGVCQDHSHVFLSCCRELGIAARYVSGYVYSSDKEEVASHAWAEAWMGNRWVSFDISNAKQAGSSHIKLAVGLDYSDACPVRGVRLGGGEESLSISAQVNVDQ
jgi:transglutaminase-like putative cysteine protease